MELFNDILMTVDRQGSINYISQYAQNLFMRERGDYFPIVCRYDSQVQTLSLDATASRPAMDFWLAPMRNPGGEWQGFAVIRRHRKHLEPLKPVIRTGQGYSSDELQSALLQHEFFLAYQPEKRQQSQHARVAEALLRWHRADGQVLKAHEFMPDAEKHGLDRDIGLWVIDEVCQQNRRWQMKGLRPISISINLSPDQLTDDRLVGHVRDRLEHCGMPAHYLQFEVNARCLHADGFADARILNQLKSLGLRIMLDDCCPSERSWHQLLVWPIDAIKVNVDSWDNTLLSVARGLGKTLIARGIEVAGTALGQHVPDALQGNAICEPLGPDRLAQVLDQGAWAA